MSIEDKSKIYCEVGMATAAALYELKAGHERRVEVEVPLLDFPFEQESHEDDEQTAQMAWDKSLEGKSSLQIPDEHFQFLCAWLETKTTMSFGPAPTAFGDIQIMIRFESGNPIAEWTGKWFSSQPEVVVRLPEL